MRNYIRHINSKSTHDRRQHAVHIAGIATAVVFIGWLATLGLRFSDQTAITAQAQDNGQSQLANVASGADSLSGDSSQNTLEVDPSSDSSAGYTSINGQ